MANINITLQGLKIYYATDTRKKPMEGGVKNGSLMLKM
jgi:hypothetical protein